MFIRKLIRKKGNIEVSGLLHSVLKTSWVLGVTFCFQALLVKNKLYFSLGLWYSH